jgi:hypothetical protein
MGDVAEGADGIGDIPTVLQLIRLGQDRPRPLRPAEIAERVDLMELWRGCLTLLQGWLGRCTQPEVLEVVVHRLRELRWPALGEAVLPPATSGDLGRPGGSRWMGHECPCAAR